MTIRTVLFPLIYLLSLAAYGLLVLPGLASQNVELTHHLRNIGLLTLLFVFLQARTWDTRTDTPQQTAPALFIPIIGGLALVFMAGIAALNYVVNPFGLYPTDNYAPVVVNSRNLKAELYEMTAPAPEIVVLGSSRSIAVDPAHIESLTGQPAFNAAVTGGVPRDFLAFLRFMLDIEKVPQTFVIGLSVDQLILDYVPLEPDRLAPYVTEGGGLLREFVYQADNLFSLQQAEASLASLLRARETTLDTPEYITFAPNSMGYFNDPRPLDQAVAEGLPLWEDRFRDESLNPAALNYLRQFLELCQQHDIAVRIYIAPYHPALNATLDAHYERIQAAYLQTLNDWQRDLDFTVYDFSDPASTGITAAMFYDVAHPNPEGNQHIMDAIFDDL